MQDYIRRAQAKGVTTEALADLSDRKAKEPWGKGHGKAARSEDGIDFKTADIELQRKGMPLALLWQEGKRQ